MRDSRGHVLCLIGGQYGSEGKGVIAAYLANRYALHVRVGGPNAGHSFWFDGKVWKMRSLPCGWTNEGAALVIGPGAILEPEVLNREIVETETDPDRVFVDEKAFILEPELDRTPDPDRDYNLRAQIGATGEGTGPARLRRMRRYATEGRQARDIAHLWPWNTVDTVAFIDDQRNRGDNVLLEGTQGVHLSLIHGPWPYATSADCGAAQLLADCGVPPTDDVRTLMVIRQYPIRVGGNSGPLPNETTWQGVSEIAGRPVEEFTTVTGRLRRVAHFYPPDVKRSIQLNDPEALALMFLDYQFPEVTGVGYWGSLSQRAREHIRYMEMELETKIRFVGTGGETFNVVEVP